MASHSEWECPACTMQNERDAEYCNACLQVSPDSLCSSSSELISSFSSLSLSSSSPAFSSSSPSSSSSSPLLPFPPLFEDKQTKFINSYQQKGIPYDDIFIALETWDGDFEAAAAALDAFHLVELISSFEDLIDLCYLQPYEDQLKALGYVEIADFQRLTLAILTHPPLAVPDDVAHNALNTLHDFFTTAYDQKHMDKSSSLFGPLRIDLRQSMIGLSPLLPTPYLAVRKLLPNNHLEADQIGERLDELKGPAVFHSRRGLDNFKLDVMIWMAKLVLGCPLPLMYIYGGFVRDFIIRDEVPNDIDCRIIGDNCQFDIFWTYFSSHIPATILLNDAEVGINLLLDRARPTQFIICVIIESLDEILFTIDVSFSSDYEDRTPHPLDKTDASVNNIKVLFENDMLTLKKKSNSDPIPLRNVVEQILNKEFVTLLNPNSAYLQGRYHKLLLKGYARIVFQPQ